VTARQGLPSASHHRAGGIVYSFPEASNDIRGDQGRRIQGKAGVFATFEPAGHTVGEQEKHIGWPQHERERRLRSHAIAKDALFELDSPRNAAEQAAPDVGISGAQLAQTGPALPL
jgi:hypothetical protein